MDAQEFGKEWDSHGEKAWERIDSVECSEIYIRREKHE